MLLAPHLHIDLEWKRCLQDTRIIRIRIQTNGLALLIFWLGELKCPQQFRRDTPHVAFRKMHSGTNASASPVAVVVAVFPVRATGVVVCQLWVVEIAVWIEAFVVFENGVRVVDSPDRYKYSAVLRDEHTLIFVVFPDSMRRPTDGPTSLLANPVLPFVPSRNLHWSPPHTLFHHGIDVWKILEIRPQRRSIGSTNFVNIHLSLLLHIGILGPSKDLCQKLGGSRICGAFHQLTQ